MSEAADRSLGSIMDACCRLDKGGSGQVSLSAYLLAVQRSGIHLEGGERERAKVVADAGGNAVRLPAAWGLDCGRKGESEGGGGGGGGGVAGGHGSVRYAALDQRVRAACSKMLGRKVSRHKFQAGGRGGLDEQGWNVALAQAEAESAEGLQVQMAKMAMVRAGKTGNKASSSSSSSNMNNRNIRKGTAAEAARSKSVQSLPPSGKGGVGIGYFGETRVGDAGFKAMKALLEENAALRQAVDKEEVLRGGGGGRGAESASRRAVGMQVLLAMQWLEEAEGRHSAVEERERELRERGEAVEAAEERVKEGTRELSCALREIEEREAGLRRREEEWEAGNPSEAGLKQQVARLEEEVTFLSESLREREKEARGLRETVASARKEVDVERQRSGMLVALAKDHREACQVRAPPPTQGFCAAHSSSDNDNFVVVPCYEQYF